MRQSNSPWTDIKINQLKALWVDGLSCSIIGNELGVSRCAVIGKVHRLGLSDRKRGVNPLTGRTKPKPRTASTVPRLKAHQRVEYAQYVEWAQRVESTEHRCTLMELTSETCRWPIIEGKQTFYCGAQALGAYCAHHTRIAYQPSKPRQPFIPQRKAAVTAAFAGGLATGARNYIAEKHSARSAYDLMTGLADDVVGAIQKQA